MGRRARIANDHWSAVTVVVEWTQEPGGRGVWLEPFVSVEAVNSLGWGKSLWRTKVSYRKRIDPRGTHRLTLDLDAVPWKTRRLRIRLAKEKPDAPERELRDEMRPVHDITIRLFDEATGEQAGVHRLSLGPHQPATVLAELRREGAGWVFVTGDAGVPRERARPLDPGSDADPDVDLAEPRYLRPSKPDLSWISEIIGPVLYGALVIGLAGAVFVIVFYVLAGIAAALFVVVFVAIVFTLIGSLLQ